MHFRPENCAMAPGHLLGENMASRPAWVSLRLHIEQRRASGRTKSKAASSSATARAAILRICSGSTWMRALAAILSSDKASSSASSETADLRASPWPGSAGARSEEHTSELQSLMRISYAVFCLKKKQSNKQYKRYNTDAILIKHNKLQIRQ